MPFLQIRKAADSNVLLARNDHDATRCGPVVPFGCILGIGRGAVVHVSAPCTASTEGKARREMKSLSRTAIG